MDLITPEIRERLLANIEAKDPMPVVKFFTPDANATWLISEMDPENEDMLFGLCDLGLGSPELGWVSLSEIQSVRGRFGLPVERDLHWRPTMTLELYAKLAIKLGRISEI